jgi:hypothetical protein
MGTARVSLPLVVGVALIASLAGAVCAGPAMAMIDAVMSCSQSTPCLEWDNAGSGDAVKGVSTKGDALHGQTKFKSAGKTAGKAGVFGEDLSSTGNLNAGVLGSSTNGTGVVGESTALNGVEGLTAGPGTSGVYGQNSDSTGYGVAGRNVGSSLSSGAGVLADGGLYGYGLRATSTNGGGALIYSQNDVPLIVQTGYAGGNVPVIWAFDANDQQLMVLDSSGNISIRGLLYSSGQCQNGCVEGRRRVNSVAEYAAVEAEPTIEDNGETALADGRAYVALDPKFANVIDTTKAYLVTLTPEGDCSGLYVTGRTRAGFTVREIHGGRSSVGFAYRIVASRLGVHAQRLPMMTVGHAAVPHPLSHHVGGL